ncbi:acyl carrier protein [Streptomyces sp. NPDC002004]
MDHSEAIAVVKEALTRIAPDADFTEVGPHDRFSDALDLDSVDFLALMEILSARAGVRIGEQEFAELTTLADAAEFLVGHTP